MKNLKEKKLNYCLECDTVFKEYCLECEKKELEYLESEEYKKGEHEDFLTDIARDIARDND